MNQALIGIYFKTRKDAQKRVLEQQRLSKEMYAIVEFTTGFLVVSEKQLQNVEFKKEEIPKS